MVTQTTVQVGALGPTGTFQARNRVEVTDTAGTPVAELSLVPALFVNRTMSALRRSRPLALEARRAAMAKAAELFGSATVGGMSPGEYEEIVSRVSGLAISVVRDATTRIATYSRDAHDHAESARPQGSVRSWHTPTATSGTAVWMRRGEVFGVHAAGNHPAVHTNWLQALALGYRVAVRPSRREPFTAFRLVAALRTAGFPDDHVAMLPTDHDVADQVLHGADLSMVYGGEDVMRKYAADPRVLPQGPGRAKILITEGQDWTQHLDMMVDSVSRNGGVSCVNTTAILVEGDAQGLAEALAARLSQLPTRDSLAEDAILPVHSVVSARAVDAFLQRTAQGAHAILGGSGIVDEMGDGTAVLRPSVHLLPSGTDPRLQVELPYPCVWVAPWDRQAGAAALSGTLALSVITDDEQLVEQLMQDPSIRNVHVGPVPTYWSAPGVPHDGFLADFLMESRGFVRA